MAFNRLTRALNQLSQAFGSRPSGLPVPPTGFAYLIDSDGLYVIDSDGLYLLVLAS